VSKLWRYDWCKNACWCVVVGSNTEDCATRWWDHIGWADEHLRYTILKFWWACSTRVAPLTGEISSYIPALKFVLFPLKQWPRHWSQMVPNKTLAFCCCALRCISNSNELVCSKMEKEGSKSNEMLQVQKVAVVATWRCDRIAMVLWNLIWPKLKPHDNFVLPHHLKSTYYTQIWFASYSTPLLYVLQFSATLLTKNLLNQILASTPFTHFSKNRGVLLWRRVTIWMNLLEFVKVMFLKVLQLCRPICASRTCCFVASNVCEPQRKLRDRKTVRLMNNLVT